MTELKCKKRKYGRARTEESPKSQKSEWSLNSGSEGKETGSGLHSGGLELQRPTGGGGSGLEAGQLERWNQLQEL